MKRVKPGAYTFNAAQNAFSLYSTTNILLNDSETGVVVNYTKAPISGITTDKYVLAVDRPDDSQRYTIYAYEATTAGPLSIEPGWYWFNETTSELVAIDAPTIVLSATCTILNTVSTDQINAMFTEPPIETVKEYKREFWEGQRDTSMADFEALSNVNSAMSYNLTNYPNTGITNAQMAFALTAKRLFTEGETFICLDDGTYQKGHIYKLNIVNDSKSWEDITKGLKIYTITDILNHDGIKSGTFTEEQINNIKLADILQVYAIDGDPVSKYAYKGLIPTNPAQSTIGANLYFVAATEKGNYVLAINTDTRNWEVREPVSGDLQNYVPKQSEAEPVALTWRFNDVVDVNRDNDFLVNFTSNGINFTEMGFKWSMQQSPAPKDTMYYSGPTKFQDVYYGQWSGDTAIYRTVTFEAEPSGDLLAWLESNAVPQTEVDPNTALTWTINDTNATAPTTNIIESINFSVQNDPQNIGPNFHEILISESEGVHYSKIESLVPSLVAIFEGDSLIWNLKGTDYSAYRTITFETAPTGRLLEWLQANAVPQGSSAKTYAQVTNENGAVSIRVFENSDADLQNLSITKDGVTINGKKPLTSVKPLFKHELEIAYSFLLPDSVEVNGPVMYHYLSNNGTQITNVSEIDDNFMLSGGIGKNSANTVLLLNINVIKAGISITVEAVNASTMGYITGTVGTITDTVTQLI